jgi:rubredoxin
MNDIPLHFVCPSCGALGETAEKKAVRCTACGLVSPIPTEEQAVCSEVEYFSRQYERAREAAYRVAKATTLLVAAVGLSTFMWVEMEKVFLMVALAYLLLLAALFTRPSYRVDARFHAINRNFDNPEFVGSQLAVIFRSTIQSYPYANLEDRLAAASRLYRLLARQR